MNTDNKNVSKRSVILCSICAVIWSLLVVLELVFKTYDESGAVFLLFASCAIIWDIIAIKKYRIYRSNKGK